MEFKGWLSLSVPKNHCTNHNITSRGGHIEGGGSGEKRMNSFCFCSAPEKRGSVGVPVINPPILGNGSGAYCTDYIGFCMSAARNAPNP